MMPGTRVFARLLWAVVALPPSPAAGQGMPFHTPTALPLPLSESSIRSFYASDPHAMGGTT
jgi:hypothetical protein